MSVYKLVFQDPDCKRLAPSKLKIGTYTTNTVKLVASCVFYLVHPDSKHLQEVTFYVASNNGSVFLSCATTHALGLMQHCTRLDSLPPRASLITSRADNPKKTKFQISVHVSKKSMKCLARNVWYSSSLQARNKFLPITQRFLIVLDAILVLHTISRSIPVSHPSNSLSTNPCGSKRVL